MSKIVALIPARGGSKHIPLKNIKPFCGYPLIYWVAKAASDSHLISEVFVATDSSLIKNTVEELKLNKVKVIDRSVETATDKASTESLMIEFANNHAFDIIVLIQATSPLLTSNDIDSGIEKMINDQCDSLLSVVRQKRFTWGENNGIAYPINYDPVQRPLRQQWDGYLVENGAFYITGRNDLLASSCRISGKTGFFEMHESSYYELDEPEDWMIVEYLKQQKKEMEIDFNKINLLICDVDGVLTDGGMYYSQKGEEFKKFNTIDGHGLRMLQEAGIKIMFLTREETEIVRQRANKLNVDFLFMGIKDKLLFLKQFFQDNLEYGFNTIAYIGDDLNDIAPIESAYFSAVPSDGDEQLKRKANYICNKGGGEGCVREICDLILAHREEK